MAVEMFASLVPVRRDQEKGLRAVLDGLGTSDQSPFAAVPGTHVARLAVIRRVGAAAARDRRLHTALLSFSALVDGPVEDWLGSLPAACGAAGDAVWNHCAGWPGPEPADAFARWLLDFRLPMHTCIIAHEKTSVGEVTTAIEQRKLLLRLAVAARGLDDGELRRAYNEAFGSLATVAI
jgi:hypothetical protein